MNRVLEGAGLGLRRDMLDEILQRSPDEVDFYEVAPENWMTLGGALGRKFAALTQRHRFVLHGLSLSIGSPDPLDEGFVEQIAAFMDEHGIELYSEHLSYCSADGHLYDLLPIPFTEESVTHVVSRIQRVQQLIGRQLVIENVSYYAAPGQQMAEIDFINAVLHKADCLLLLDVNNIYVNSVNHGYDAMAFLSALPSDRICYGHIAGHYQQDVDLIIDTHGEDVIDPVWQLLERAYDIHGVFPTLLERDFNLPPLSQLLDEVRRIHHIQMAAQQSGIVMERA